MDLDWSHCPKLVDFETRRSRIEPEAPNYLTTPKGCFFGGKWHTRDMRPPAARLRAAHGKVPRFCAAIAASSSTPSLSSAAPGDGDGGGVAAPEPDDELEALGEIGRERALRTERAASLRPMDGGGGGRGGTRPVVGWHEEQRQRGEPGFSGEGGWEKSKYELSPHLRELMFGYGTRHE